MTSENIPEYKTYLKSSSAWRLFGLAFITGFSGAIMPGPLLVAVIGQTNLQGFKGMFWLVTGHAILEIVTVCLLAFGLARVIARPRVRGFIGVIGGAGLVWMGYDMFCSLWGLSLNLDQSAQQAMSIPVLILWGAFICAANPYFTGWWATIGVGQMATMAPKNFKEYLAFYFGHELSDYTWYTIVAAIILGMRNWLTDDMYRGLIGFCAIAILIIGIWFIGTGFKFIWFKNNTTTQDSETIVE